MQLDLVDGRDDIALGGESFQGTTKSLPSRLASGQWIRNRST
jgi:hypothetical protein